MRVILDNADDVMVLIPNTDLVLINYEKIYDKLLFYMSEIKTKQFILSRFIDSCHIEEWNMRGMDFVLNSHGKEVYNVFVMINVYKN